MVKHALPNTPYNAKPRPEWTESEKWVWQQICEGKIADFNGGDQTLDPGSDQGWSGDRIISPAFLKTILLTPPFCNALPSQGVRIVGAWIKEPVDLSYARIAHQFWLDNSRIDAFVNLLLLRSTEFLSFEQSVFGESVNLSLSYINGLNMNGVKIRHELQMSSLSVGGSLSLQRAQLQEVDLSEGKVEGILNMTGATVQNLTMYDLSVGRDLILADVVATHDMKLGHAKIDGQVNMGGAKVRGKFGMQGLSVGASLFLGDAELQEADLTGARVDRQISMNGVKLHGKLIMSGLSVGGDLLLGGSELQEVNLFRSKVSGLVSMTDAKIQGKLDIDTVSIGGDLFLLEASVTQESYLVAVQVRGKANMKGVKVQGKLSMISLSVGASLFLGDGAELMEVNLAGAEVGGHVNMDGARVKGALTMEGLSIGGHLLLRDGVEMQDVDLAHATVRGLVNMFGAKIRGKLNMVRLSVGVDLYLQDAELQEVVLGGARINGQVNMNSVKVHGKLNMDTVSIGGDLYLRNGARLQEVDLRGADIHGWVSMSGAQVLGKLTMNGLLGGDDLHMEGAELQEVELIGAKVNGVMSMTGAKVQGTLNMNSISVGGHLFLDSGAEFMNVDIGSAKVRGQVSMTNARIQGELLMESVTIGQHLLLRDAIFLKKIHLVFANIDSGIDISRATVSIIDMSGACVKGELSLGAVGQKPNWQEPSCLILRNAEVGALQDAGEDKDVWPHEMDLDGLMYKRLGGYSSEMEDRGQKGHSRLLERDSSWFITYLEKCKYYSPQPYRQLAHVLNMTGNSGKANAVLYAGKKRETDEAFRNKNWGKWFGLKLLQLTTGYGFGYRYFFSLVWVLLFTFAGFLALTTIGGDIAKYQMPEKIAYSFNLLLPFIKLNEDYKITRAFSGWQLYYFYFHELVGYLLGSFVLAGLAGITKK